MQFPYFLITTRTFWCSEVRFVKIILFAPSLYERWYFFRRGKGTWTSRWTVSKALQMFHSQVSLCCRCWNLNICVGMFTPRNWGIDSFIPIGTEKTYFSKGWGGDFNHQTSFKATNPQPAANELFRVSPGKPSHFFRHQARRMRSKISLSKASLQGKALSRGGRDLTDFSVDFGPTWRIIPWRT